MRPTPDYRLKCVTVVTPYTTFGGGFSKKRGSPNTVITALGPFFELIHEGTANSGDVTKLFLARPPVSGNTKIRKGTANSEHCLPRLLFSTLGIPLGFIFSH